MISGPRPSPYRTRIEQTRRSSNLLEPSILERLPQSSFARTSDSRVIYESTLPSYVEEEGNQLLDHKCTNSETREEV